MVLISNKIMSVNSHNQLKMILIKIFMFNIIFLQTAYSSILNPPIFNLASNKQIVASATCGDTIRDELYCKLTGSTTNERDLPEKDHEKPIQVLFS